ncbi:MAG: NAD(P)-binding protein, partial [Parvibaculum sp.]
MTAQSSPALASPASAGKVDPRFALIGAGPMGLAAAKTLLEQGVEFQGFEIHSDVGGLWDIDGPKSTMYDTAHLISSKRMTEFADFPMDEDVAEYPSHRDLKHYFRKFADHFGLRERYLFKTEVVSAKPLGASGEG